MKFKKRLVKSLLYPPIPLLCLLAVVSGGLLVYTMLNLPDKSIIRICSYVFAFYALTAICIRVPDIIKFFIKLKNGNRYINIWQNDAFLRIKVTLRANILWNGAYAVLQFCLGIKHASLWYFSLFAYYASLAFMRLYLVEYTVKKTKDIKQEIKRYRNCGKVFLLLNLSLSVMTFYMIRDDRTIKHHRITVIAMATYTFVSFTFAVINVIKYRKYNSPVLSATKSVSLASSCVSMMTLENTMLNAFSTGNTAERVLFLTVTGFTISLFITAVAVYMIVQSNKKFRLSED